MAELELEQIDFVERYFLRVMNEYKGLVGFYLLVCCPNKSMSSSHTKTSIFRFITRCKNHFLGIHSQENYFLSSRLSFL